MTPLPGTARVPATVLILGGIGSVQFGAAIATTMFDQLGPAGTALLRVGLAAVILVAVWRPRVRRLGVQRWRSVALFGFVLGAMNLTFYEALGRIPLGTAVTIEFIGPLGVALALSRRTVDAGIALLAAAGIVLLTHPWHGTVDALGVAFALAAGGCWAAYILIAQRASKLFSGSDGVALAMVFAALVTLAPGVVAGGGALLRPGALALGVVVALMCSVIPYSLETEALRRIDARVFGVLMSLEPAVAALAGFVLIGQQLEPLELCGIALVVTASVGVTRSAVPDA